MHVAVYEWMMNKNMTGEMIKITKPTLETFLMRSAQQNPDSIPVLDVMWKYYESNGNHAAAAKVLNNLASMPGYYWINYFDRYCYCIFSFAGTLI